MEARIARIESDVASALAAVIGNSSTRRGPAPSQSRANRAPDVPPGTLRAILKQARIQPPRNPVPDLPGCIAAAKTRDEVVKLIQDAMEFHIMAPPSWRLSAPRC
jgi:hypothetical protein